LRKLKIKDVVWPVIITATIFLGPIVDELFTRRWFARVRNFNAVWRNRPDIWTILRNWVLGPLVEEIVFRCINCTLLSGDMPTHYTVIISGLLFGAAHFHPQIMQHVFLDMERQILIDSLIQFLYTSAFGMYVATIFMKTRSLWPAAAVHIFCNIMGLPSGDIVRTKWLQLVTTSGIAAWLLLYTNYLMGEA
jgi:prenyl protein peptidase